jgi:hypothetical protein
MASSNLQGGSMPSDWFPGMNPLPHPADPIEQANRAAAQAAAQLATPSWQPYDGPITQPSIPLPRDTTYVDGAGITRYLQSGEPVPGQDLPPGTRMTDPPAVSLSAEERARRAAERWNEGHTDGPKTWGSSGGGSSRGFLWYIAVVVIVAIGVLVAIGLARWVHTCAQINFNEC